MSWQALGEYIGDLLKPLYAAKRISKDQFKAVARRAADKVGPVKPYIWDGTLAGCHEASSPATWIRAHVGGS